MTAQSFDATFEKILVSLERMIPVYGADPQDSFAGGNVAVCIFDEDGRIYGKVWGQDKVRGRNAFRLAWTKASQVWITGMKTGEYEKKLFNGEFDEGRFGIQMPDLIGWEGGQPMTHPDGRKISVGFSGFRGINDLEIMVKAVAELK